MKILTSHLVRSSPLGRCDLRIEDTAERRPLSSGTQTLRAYPNTPGGIGMSRAICGVVVPRIARRCVDGRWISVKVSPDPRGLVGTDRSGDPHLQKQL